jgi:hypothetical protein
MRPVPSEEGLLFTEAPKWLKRICNRIVYHFKVRGKRKVSAFIPTHFSMTKQEALAWNNTWAYSFDRFDQDVEEATFGQNSTEGEKERHKKNYQVKKE